MSAVMLCNKATDPHRKSSVGGYQCLNCHADLVVTPSGIESLKHHSFDMYCMSCGLKVAEEYQAQGKLGSIGLSPEAVESLRKRLGVEPPPPASNGTANKWAAALGIDVPDGVDCEIVEGAQRDRVIDIARDLIPILRNKTTGPKEAAMVLALLVGYVEKEGGGKVFAVAAIPNSKHGDN